MVFGHIRLDFILYAVGDIDTRAAQFADRNDGDDVQQCHRTVGPRIQNAARSLHEVLQQGGAMAAATFLDDWIRD
jgi:hypothetical protein